MGLLDTRTTGSIRTRPTGVSADVAGGLASGLQQNQQAANQALARLLDPNAGTLDDPALVQLRDAITQQVNDQFFAPGGIYQQGNVQRQQTGGFSSSGSTNILDRLAQQFTQSLGQALAVPQFEFVNAARNRALQGTQLQTQGALGASQLDTTKDINITQRGSPLSALGTLLGGVGLGLRGLFGKSGLVPGLSTLFSGGGAAAEAFTGTRTGRNPGANDSKAPGVDDYASYYRGR